MNVKIATLSDIGGRSNNDDTVAVRQKEDSAWVFVGDGLGGYAGGQMASEAAAKAVMDASHRGSLLIEARLAQTAAAANEAVCQVQREKKGNMKTTLVFLTIEDGRAKWMHVGDSRLYHFRNGLLVDQTIDHSVSQMAVLMGEITPREIRFHEDRNRVLRALGSETARPEISPTVMLTGGEDAFLLCTDGFWEYIYEEEMESMLQKAQSPQQWLEEMKALLVTRTPEDNDNFTAAAVFC